MSENPRIKNKGVAKVPVIMQMESRECGAACLSMVLAYYGRWVPLEQMRRECGVSRSGVSAGSILRVARDHGCEAKGYTLETKNLRARIHFPCIIYWEYEHFAVLCGFKGKRAVLINPRKGMIRLDLETFEKSFSGLCLDIYPGRDFQKAGSRHSVFSFIKDRLKTMIPAVSVLTVVMVLNSLFGYIDPRINQRFLDTVLTAGSTERLYAFIRLAALIAFLEICVAFAQRIFRLLISGTLFERESTSFMKTLMRLPERFYDQRRSTELLGRFSRSTNVSLAIVNTFAPLLVQSVMMVFFLTVMVRSSLLLSAVGLCTVIINLAVTRWMAQRRTEYARVMINDTSKLNSATVTGIEMMETLRASGAEEGYLKRWKGYQKDMFDRQSEFAKKDLFLSVWPAYLSVFANYLVMIIGVYLTMQGSFTLGLMTAFGGYLSAFFMPANTLIDTGKNIFEMRVDMERIRDVTDYPKDPFLEEKTGRYNGRLSGEASLTNVSFSYDKGDDPAVAEVSLRITPGKRIALVGKSGCGKTTLLKLMTGIYQPDAGDITYDGHALLDISHKAYTDSVAIVSQDTRLFDESILENIRLWDESIPEKKVEEAAKAAAIHEEILTMEGGYAHRLSDRGYNLSGGQRQRIEIARALAKDPALLLLDEATSALDARTEKQIFDSVKERKIACIIVSHRISAVRDCDEILVMEKGRIVARGAHAALLDNCEAYKELIADES